VRPAAAFRRRYPSSHEEGSVIVVWSTVTVDDELVWVVRPPQVLAASVRPATADYLLGLTQLLDAEAEAARQHDFLARVLDTFARAVSEAEHQPPLSLIGEPFGGGGGTD
jgi:hypothetical protein